jgi:predicted metal-dependent phosphoesterase TrpH
MAALLVEKGYVRTIGQAFRKYLGRGRPAYAERFKPDFDLAVDALREAGGVSVLCHPLTLGLDVEDLSTIRCPLGEFVAGLAARGLDAIEVHYADHTSAQRQFFEALARDCGLLASGGSDFHGLTERARRAGFARALPYELLADLRRRAETR